MFFAVACDCNSHWRREDVSASWRRADTWWRWGKINHCCSGSRLFVKSPSGCLMFCRTCRWTSQKRHGNAVKQWFSYARVPGITMFLREENYFVRWKRAHKRKSDPVFFFQVSEVYFSYLCVTKINKLAAIAVFFSVSTSAAVRKGKSPGTLAMALKLVKNHGPRRLLSGAGATFTGYFLHGAFKYGALGEILLDFLLFRGGLLSNQTEKS